MNNPGIVLWIVLGVQTVVVLLLFLACLSDSWLSIETENSDLMSGIFEACAEIKRDVDWKKAGTGWLTASKVFAVFSMIFGPVFTVSLVAYTAMHLLEVETLTKAAFIVALVSGAFQFVCYSLTVFGATRFYNSLDWIESVDGQVVTTEGLTFGWGKVVAWINWIFMLAPTGLLGYYAFGLYRTVQS